MKSEFKKCEAYFLKEAKVASVQVRSLPAVEAKTMNLKDVGKTIYAMKKIFLIVFIFQSVLCFSQEVNTNNVNLKLKKNYKANSLSFISANVFFSNFSVDTSQSNFINLAPNKIYKISATIFDATYILLLKGNKFIATHASCLQESSTGGSYKIVDNQLILNSSKQIYNSIRKTKCCYELKYKFIDIGQQNYLIKGDSIIYKK